MAWNEIAGYQVGASRMGDFNKPKWCFTNTLMPSNWAPWDQDANKITVTLGFLPFNVQKYFAWYNVDLNHIACESL